MSDFQLPSIPIFDCLVAFTTIGSAMIFPTMKLIVLYLALVVPAYLGVVAFPISSSKRHWPAAGKDLSRTHFGNSGTLGFSSVELDARADIQSWPTLQSRSSLTAPGHSTISSTLEPTSYWYDSSAEPCLNTV
ncbi:hypothetical protein EIP91_003555 [Steccherinum ochraceum]|uniref:Uncharacterized protein n=1 Tax=Steccherinum ochraceum TaxID=92696 RepID=A0A4R0RAC3_9APHY|nr:hypothetical protein EIP91_003555 [Steccherinum ochraceum]